MSESTVARSDATRTIRTPRLLLRRWRDADREPFADMNADPEVREYMQGPMTREESDAFVDRIAAQWETAGWGLWAVEVPGRALFIGYVGLWPWDVLGAPMVEIGWRVAREHWGQGYATEAAREALRFGFEVLHLPEIVSFTVPQNERSRRVMERVGLVHDPADDFDNPNVDPNRYPELVRHVLYRISRQAWDAQAERPLAAGEAPR